MAMESFSRHHLLRAALRALGVPPEGFRNFYDRFVIVAVANDLFSWWNTPLETYEVSRLIQIYGGDTTLSEEVLERQFQHISEKSSIPEAEIWAWAVPHAVTVPGGSVQSEEL